MVPESKSRSTKENVASSASGAITPVHGFRSGPHNELSTANLGPTSIPLYDIGALTGASCTLEVRGLRLTTPPHEGEFAAFCDVKAPAGTIGVRHIDIALEVLRGRLGVGWFQQGTKTWVGHLNVSQGKHIVQLSVPAAAIAAGQLIFQNNTPDGAGTAEACIEAIFLLAA